MSGARSVAVALSVTALVPAARGADKVTDLEPMYRDGQVFITFRELSRIKGERHAVDLRCFNGAPLKDPTRFRRCDGLSIDHWGVVRSSQTVTGLRRDGTQANTWVSPEMYRRYFRKTFAAYCDLIQGVLPRGTPAEVAEHVRTRADLLGEGGGCIFGTGSCGAYHTVALSRRAL
jgi:hypothetical protein